MGAAEKLEKVVVAERYTLDALLFENSQISVHRAFDAQTRTDVTFLFMRKVEIDASVISAIELYKTIPVACGWKILDWRRVDESLYITTPCIAGPTLRDLMKTGPLSFDALISILKKITFVLMEYERRGIVHGDLRPEHILLSDDSEHCYFTNFVMPFCQQSPSSSKEVKVRDVLYMSPEQAGSIRSPLGIHSDLYSLGIMVFECITGRPPFVGDDYGAILHMHLNQGIPTFPSLGIKVPRVFSEIFDRLTHKDPKDRYQTASGLYDDLRGVATGTEEERDTFVVGLSDVRKDLTSPSFVGRTQELNQILGIVRKAQSGHGGVIKIHASSGCGKTKLLMETIKNMSGKGMRTHLGFGVEEAAKKPLALFERTIQSLVKDLSANPALREQFQKAIGPYLSTLLEIFPDLLFLDSESAKSHLKEEHAEARSLEALCRMINFLGQNGRSALLGFDDIQWADELSLKAVDAWARRLHANGSKSVSVVIILSYRSEEIGIRHIIRGVTNLATIGLDALSQKALERYLQSMAGPLPHKTMGAIYKASQGNPFFARAILQGYVETKALRPSLKGWVEDASLLTEIQSSKKAAELLTERLNKLDAPVLEYLTSAAVMGKIFSASAVASILGLSPERASEITNKARSQHLLLWADEDKCTFAHDKLRESLLMRLSADKKQKLHRAIARFLIEGHDSDDFEIAFHLDKGTEHQTAVQYALRAATIARKRNSLEVAASQYQIAQRGILPSNRELNFAIAKDLGNVLMLIGDYQAADAQLLRAQNFANTRIDSAHVDALIGELQFKRGNIEEASNALILGLRTLRHFIPRNALLFLPMVLWEVLVQTAHTLAPRMFTGRKRIEGEKAREDLLASYLYGRLTYAWFFQKGVKPPTLWSHLRQMNGAEVYDRSPELGQAYSTHGPVMGMIPWHRRAILYSLRGVRIRRQIKDSWGEAQGLHFLGAAYYASSQLEKALRTFSRSIKKLEATGDRWELNGCTYHYGVCQYRLGNLSEAFRAGNEVHESGKLIGDNFASGASLNIISKATLGMLDAQAVHIELEKHSEDQQRNAEVWQAEGLRLLHAEEYEGAYKAMGNAWAIIARSGLHSEYVASVPTFRATILRRWILSLSQVETQQRKVLLRAMLLNLRLSWLFVFSFKNNQPHYYRERGYYFALAGRPDEAHKNLLKSMQVARDLDMRFELAQSQMAFGELGMGFEWPNAEETYKAAQLQATEFEINSNPSAAAPTLSLIDRFDTLLIIGRNIASSLSLEEIERRLRTDIPLLFRCNDVSLFEVSDSNIITKRFGTKERYSERLIANAMKLQKCLGLYYSDEEDATRYGGKSLLIMPIFSNEGKNYCAYICHPEIERFFGEDEIKLAEFVASLIEVAIDNAFSFQKIRELTNSLELDIRQRKNTELELAKNLNEKEVLLREIFHRTKNNMQIISALLNLQMNDSTDESIIKLLRESQNRIRSMALVHEKLYKSGHLNEIDFSQYIKDLIDGLRHSYADLRNIEIVYRLDDSNLSIEFAIPCGLILNEIVTNSFKYAFPTNKDHGLIDIQMTAHELDADNKEFVFTVKDNGIGLPKDFDISKSSSLGLKLISGLIKTQLKGSLNLSNESGFGIRFSFVENKKKGRLHLS